MSNTYRVLSITVVTRGLAQTDSIIMHVDLQHVAQGVILLLQDTWAEVQAENSEKAMLGTGKSYDRQFP